MWNLYNSVQERSNEERETDLISRIKKAVSLGINILDSDYDRLDLNVANSDSEDDSSAAKMANVLYESKVGSFFIYFLIIEYSFEISVNIIEIKKVPKCFQI